MVPNSNQVLYNMIYLKAISYKLQKKLKHIIYLVIRELKMKLLLDLSKYLIILFGCKKLKRKIKKRTNAW